MLLHLSDLSSESLQGQLVRQVRALILGGELSAGADLPSIRSLAREQQVSVITVQRAYDLLMQEGLIHSRRGKGFFVSEISEKEKRSVSRKRLQDEIQLPIETAAAEGLSPEEIRVAVDAILDKCSNTS